MKKECKAKNDEGAIALEACISLTIFMIVMFSLYSIICMFTAQSMISHALQQAGQSLALENYKNAKWEVNTLQSIPIAILGKITGNISDRSNENLDVSGGAFSDSMPLQSYNVSSMAKSRFKSFLGGNQQQADALLKSLGVVDGADGINFGKTKISGDDLVLNVTYKIRLAFYIEMFHFGEFESTQTVCCRLWK